MSPAKRWTIAEPLPQAVELAGRLRTSRLIAQILLNRGLAEYGDCQQFLAPTLKLLHEPAMLPGLGRAAERIARAIRDREKIVIYGDYDVDGITATSILWHAIRLLGGVADSYIPHRLEEGYGMNPEAVEQICAGGAKLIISVDCGITAVEEANIAARHGVDLIVTDHHEWHRDPDAGDADGAATNGDGRPALPECYAIVHPRLPQENPYPNPSLCGAGVAFKLAWGIGQLICGGRVTEPFRNFLLDATALAALGTIADVVPLKGENRILAHFGLTGLKHSRLTGIRALIESAGLTGQKLDSYHVGFLLAPRLNACGRMGHAREAVEMMTVADEARAIEIAQYLEQQNRARQSIERTIAQEAVEQVEANGWNCEGQCGIVLAKKGWHAGVIGIVASRIVGRYNRPTIMVSLDGEDGQGSGRSISGFHLARALEACGSHLHGSGGHEMAAGLSLPSANIDAFREAFCSYAAANLSREQLVPELRIDSAARLTEMTEALVRDLDRLGPFGHGNRKPLLCCHQVEMAAAPRRVGARGDHLQLWIRQGPANMKCIAFGMGGLYDRLGPGTRIDLAVEPQINSYNGRNTVELEVKDVRFDQD